MSKRPRRLDLVALGLLPDAITADPPILAALVSILREVALEPGTKRHGRKTVRLSPGQFVLGRGELSAMAGLTPKQARRALEILEQFGIIGPADPKWTRRALLAWDSLIPPSPAIGGLELEPEGQASKPAKEEAKGPKIPPWRRLLELFVRGAGDRFLAPPDPVPGTVVIRLNQVARQLRKAEVKAGQIVAAGRLVRDYPTPVGVKWLMTEPNLWEAVQRARTERAPAKTDDRRRRTAEALAELDR